MARLNDLLRLKAEIAVRWSTSNTQNRSETNVFFRWRLFTGEADSTTGSCQLALSPITAFMLGR